MTIKIPKYKKIVTLVFAVFVMILLFEVIPGYYDLGVNLFDVIVQKISGNDTESLSSKLILLQDENNKLKQQFFNKINVSTDEYSFSYALEKFTSDNPGINISINSIKPNKKIKKGGLNFQRITIGLDGNFNDIYNYFRWLEIKESDIEFAEVGIIKQKETNLLQTNITVDVLYSGADE